MRRNQKKALYSYAGLIFIAFMMRIYPSRGLDYLFPAYLLALPFLFNNKINLSFSFRDFLLGLLVSACILLPFYIFFHKSGQAAPITLNFVLTQLFIVSFPEEVFFRGFLQDVFRNDIRSVIVVSLMFMLSHLPGFIFSGDPYALLTFFPSLAMGYLYMKTSNVLPSTIFHFLSNMVFLGFVI